MPLKNGYEATRDIRDLEKISKNRVPIIAMTADAMKGAEEKCFEAGMDAYVAKPVEIQYLKDVLGTWIDFSQTALSLRHQDDVLTKNEAKPPVDLKLIKGFIGNQVEVGNFVNMFKMQGDDFLRKLNGTCRGGESKEWVEISHGFKGCCMMIGAQGLVEHLQGAEELLVANKSDRKQSLDSIVNEYGNVVSFLENLEY
jgi:CheY-like chemotaxis protein